MARFSALLSLLIFCEISFATTLQVTTFNIRWFGLGGRIEGKSFEEFRGPSLSEYIKSAESGNVAKSNIIALQEIVDVKAVQKLFPEHNCVTYDHQKSRHQHVVLCLDKNLKLVPDGDDSNFALESTALYGGKSRPALHGLLVNKDGKKLAHVMAVHLKAHAPSTKMRLEQIRKIKEFVEKLDDGIPVLVLGDFNTHANEVDLLEGILNVGKRPLTHVKNDFAYTYRLQQVTGHRDHFWQSSSIKISKAPFVPDVCQNLNSDKERFQNNAYYNRFISDHCPVTETVELE